MSIPPRQIGQASSIKNTLLWQISKQLDRLIKVAGTTTGTTTTAP